MARELSALAGEVSKEEEEAEPGPAASEGEPRSGTTACRDSVSEEKRNDASRLRLPEAAEAAPTSEETQTGARAVVVSCTLSLLAMSWSHSAWTRRRNSCSRVVSRPSGSSRGRLCGCGTAGSAAALATVTEVALGIRTGGRGSYKKAHGMSYRKVAAANMERKGSPN